jgi:hypothetical protein
MQRLVMDTKFRDWKKIMGIHQSITEVSRFWFSELCEVCSHQTLNQNGSDGGWNVVAGNPHFF